MNNKRMFLCLLLALQMTAVCACRGEESVAEVGGVPTHGGEVTTTAETDAVTTDAVTTDAVTQTVTEPAELFAEPASAEVRQRFMESDDYAVIGQTALAFFEAYRYADIAAANALLDSPDNPYMQNSFPIPTGDDNKSPGLVLAGNGEINLINCFTDADGNVVRAAIDLGVTNDPRPEYTMGTSWLCMTMVLQEHTNDTGETERRWCITDFGLSG